MGRLGIQNSELNAIVGLTSPVPCFLQVTDPAVTYDCSLALLADLLRCDMV